MGNAVRDLVDRFSRRAWTLALLAAVLVLGAIDGLWSRPAALALATAIERDHLGASDTRKKPALGTTRHQQNNQAIQSFQQIVAETPHSPDWALFLNYLPAEHRLTAGPVRYDTQTLEDLGIERHKAQISLTGKFVEFLSFLQALRLSLPTASIENIQIGPSRARSDSLTFQLAVGFLVPTEWDSAAPRTHAMATMPAEATR